MSEQAKLEEHRLGLVNSLLDETLDLLSNLAAAADVVGPSKSGEVSQNMSDAVPIVDHAGKLLEVLTGSHAKLEIVSISERNPGTLKGQRWNQLSGEDNGTMVVCRSGNYMMYFNLYGGFADAGASQHYTDSTSANIHSRDHANLAADLSVQPRYFSLNIVDSTENLHLVDLYLESNPANNRAKLQYLEVYDPSGLAVKHSDSSADRTYFNKREPRMVQNVIFSEKSSNQEEVQYATKIHESIEGQISSWTRQRTFVKKDSPQQKR